MIYNFVQFLKVLLILIIIEGKLQFLYLQNLLYFKLQIVHRFLNTFTATSACGVPIKYRQIIAQNKEISDRAKNITVGTGECVSVTGSVSEG